MKTVKLKACNGITLVNSSFPLGQTPSGTIVFEVSEVFDDISLAKVRLQYSNYIGV